MITGTTMIGIGRNRIVRLPSDFVNWLQPWHILYAASLCMVSLCVITSIDMGRHFSALDVLVPMFCLAYAGVLIWIGYNTGRDWRRLRRLRKEAHEAN